jgi:uncharacterized protein YciI
MKHFVILINYKIPFEQFEHVVPAHREYLQTAVDAGMVLLSGPRIPRDGGVVIVRAGSETAVREFAAGDPYNLAGAAEYQILEFKPGRHQDFLNAWIGE